MRITLQNVFCVLLRASWWEWFVPFGDLEFLKGCFGHYQRKRIIRIKLDKWRRSSVYIRRNSRILVIARRKQIIPESGRNTNHCPSKKKTNFFVCSVCSVSQFILSAFKVASNRVCSLRF